MMFKVKGTTLIEMMISLLLASIIFAGLFDYLVKVKRVVAFHRNHHSLLEQKIYIKDFYQTQVQSAGYLGLLNWDLLNVYDDLSNKFIKSAIYIYNYNSSELPSNIKNKIIKNSLVIEFRQLSNQVSNIIDIDKYSMKVVSDFNLSIGDEIIVADSEHAEINKIAQLSIAKNIKTIILEKKLHYNYADYALIGKYDHKFLYVGDTSRKNNFKQKISALYLMSNGKSEEVSDYLYMQEISLGRLINRKLQYINLVGGVNLSDYSALKIKLFFYNPNIKDSHITNTEFIVGLRG